MVAEISNYFYNLSASKKETSSMDYFIDDFAFPNYKSRKGIIEEFIYMFYDRMQEFTAMVYVSEYSGLVTFFRICDRNGDIDAVYFEGYGKTEKGNTEILNTIKVLLFCTGEAYYEIVQMLQSDAFPTMKFLNFKLIDVYEKHVEDYPEIGALRRVDRGVSIDFSVWAFYSYKVNVGTILVPENEDNIDHIRCFCVYRLYMALRDKKLMHTISKLKRVIVKNKL